MWPAITSHCEVLRVLWGSSLAAAHGLAEEARNASDEYLSSDASQSELAKKPTLNLLRAVNCFSIFFNREFFPQFIVLTGNEKLGGEKKMNRKLVVMLLAVGVVVAGVFMPAVAAIDLGARPTPFPLPPPRFPPPIIRPPLLPLNRTIEYTYEFRLLLIDPPKPLDSF